MSNYINDQQRVFIAEILKEFEANKHFWKKEWGLMPDEKLEAARIFYLKTENKNCCNVEKNSCKCKHVAWSENKGVMCNLLDKFVYWFPAKTGVYMSEKQKTDFPDGCKYLEQKQNEQLTLFA